LASGRENDREANVTGIREDPRWRRLQNRKWECTACGQTHTGIFDVAFDKPAVWPDDNVPISNADLAPGLTHFLSDDFCVLDNEHYFVRCVLELPILGADQALGFGVWSSLSRDNFGRYVENFNSDDRGTLGPWFGWFSNGVPGYPDTLNLKCRVHPRGGRSRPLIELEPTDHPLARDQRYGIRIDRLIEIYAACGHDLRAALSD
jgi:hypothetical protein